MEEVEKTQPELPLKTPAELYFENARCNFCGRSRQEVFILIQGSFACICNLCLGEATQKFASSLVREAESAPNSNVSSVSQ